MAIDNKFGNRHYIGNVGDMLNDQLPEGNYRIAAGQAAPGITITETGLVAGTITEPGVHVLILECCP